MFTCLRQLLLVPAVVVIAGCAGLAEMKEVEFVDSVEPEMAMVNIVRPRVFAGDGAKVEMWDGDKLIGTLHAGTMIQYQTDPGDHAFMLYVQGSWAIAKGTLKPGKTYYLKPNSGFGFMVLGVARANDPRIEKWNSTLTPMAIDAASSKSVPNDEIESAREILQKVENGSAKFQVISDLHAI